MKRNIAGLILSGLMVVLFASCGGAPFPETTTLDGVTYTVIAKESDFDKMRTALTENYYLWRDIALTGDFEPLAPDTNTSQPFFQGDPFTGIFEGNNKTISNLRIVKSSEDFVGLFGQIGSGTPVDSDVNGVVRNLTLVLAAGTVDAPSVEGADSVGALAGWSYGKIEAVGVEGGFVKGTGKYVGGLVGTSNGPITSSYATGSVTGTSNVGGLVGYTGRAGSITSSYATGSVKGTNDVGGLVGSAYGDITSSYATGEVKGDDYTGGLVGEAYGDITSSYATGLVKGDDYTGGLVGANYGDITSSYARGSVTGTGSNVGRLVGWVFSGGTITSSYFDTSNTGQGQGVGNDPNDTGVTGITASNIMQSDFVDDLSTVDYVEWDFTTPVWRWVADGQWPLLAWQ